jgi:hypothetical protein
MSSKSNSDDKDRKSYNNSVVDSDVQDADEELKGLEVVANAEEKTGEDLVEQTTMFGKYQDALSNSQSVIANLALKLDGNPLKKILNNHFFSKQLQNVNNAVLNVVLNKERNLIGNQGNTVKVAKIQEEQAEDAEQAAIDSQNALAAIRNQKDMLQNQLEADKQDILFNAQNDEETYEGKLSAEAAGAGSINDDSTQQ